MEIEVYDLTEHHVDETGLIVTESDPEALALIEQLGLEGQQELNAPTEEGEKPIRNHYGKLNLEQQTVIFALFPKICKVESYDDAPLPLRILKEIAFAKEMFKQLYICYAPPAEVIDPILIGSNESLSTSHYRHYLFDELSRAHLIARWGDALAPWADLYKDAQAKLALGIESKLKGMIGKINVQLARLAEGEMPTGKDLTRDPSFSHLPFDD